jgi:hypothetical protein
MAERNTRIKGSQIQADTVEPSNLKATNSPSDTLVPSYDVTTGQFTWIVAGSDDQTADEVPTDETGVSVQDHIDNTNNPHAVTKAQVGLTNVTDDAQLKLDQTTHQHVISGTPVFDEGISILAGKKLILDGG